MSSPPVPATWPVRVIAGLGALGFVVLFLSTLAGVVARLFGWQSWSWSFEVAGISFLWVTFLGVVLAEIRRENVRFTGLVDRCSRHGSRIVAGMAFSVTLAVTAWLAWGGWQLMLRSGMSPTPILRWPSGVNMAALITGSLLIAGLMLYRLLRLLGRRRA